MIAKFHIVTPSLEAAVINGKYVNSLPLYRMEQEFKRNDVNLNRQNMANWTIQCADRYLAILYDYLHKLLYGYHVLQADETPVEVTKDGRDAGAKSFLYKTVCHTRTKSKFYTRLVRVAKTKYNVFCTFFGFAHLQVCTMVLS